MSISKKLSRHWLPLVLIGVPAGWCVGQEGPNSSLFSRPLTTRGMSLRYPDAGPEPDYAPQSAAPFSGSAGYGYGQMGAPVGTSWYEIPLPPPREAHVNDIVTIRVDLGARVISEGDFQRRKNMLYDAVLKDWLVFDGLRSVKPAPQTDGNQRVQGELNSIARTQSDQETAESIKFDIAAKVAAILPNGTLVLEAHREIRSNEETWLVSLSGVCRREDIQPGNVVLSKDIAELKIDKRELGAIRDSYKRGWLTRWYDTLNPF